LQLRGKYKGTGNTCRDFADHSKTGTVSYPRLASKEKGEAFIEKTLAYLAEFIRDFKLEPLPSLADPLAKKAFGSST
jgi:creatinine amidohydrolase/Fe(II)-dependent formamide hydrolase-like protein